MTQVHAASTQRMLKVLNYKHCCYKTGSTNTAPPPATHTWMERV